ncbi:hypothetical protein AB8O64_14625 [Streptomyces sp. QH1-20]|uniref:hypothetical protein n=1 Tax=Streptomyces sp. QH1-20 TaxID=3240934 RepID=UPI0035117243
MKSDELGIEVAQDQGAWTIRMWWPTGRPITGGPQRITIEDAEGAPAAEVARGISTTVLRRLDLSGAVKAAQEIAAASGETFREINEAVETTGEAAGLALANEGVSERYLALLSLGYCQMTVMGAPRPVDWLARLIDRRPETVRDHLKKARRDGYLTAVTGKAGGELTDKAHAVLDAMKSE